MAEQCLKAVNEVLRWVRRARCKYNTLFDSGEFGYLQALMVVSDCEPLRREIGRLSQMTDVQVPSDYSRLLQQLKPYD